MFGPEPEFIVAELTRRQRPQMAELRDLAAASRTSARDNVIARARNLAAVPA